MSKAILVVSFGTSFKETREKTIGACERVISEKFSDYSVYGAYTSNMVIRSVKRKENIDIDTVTQALEKMKNDGIKEVYIQPLHVILGSEYEKILHQALAYQFDFDTISIGKPLLHSMEDYEQVTQFLVDKYNNFGENHATVLMGHGSQHYAFTTYAAVDHMLLDTNVFVGAVESYPAVEEIAKRIPKNITDIHLAPFMLVAGDHATNDMASDEEDSWYTFFKNKGYNVHTHLVGMGEYEEVRQMYVAHLEKAMNSGDTQ